MSNQAVGILWTYFLFAIVITIPVSSISLLWYRRAVVRNMGARSEHQGTTAAAGVDESGERSLEDTRSIAPAELGDITTHEARLRRRLAVIYTAGGLVAAAGLTVLFFTLPGIELAALRVFLVWYTFSWPIVPTIAPLLALSRRRTILLFLGYLFVGAVVILAWSSVNKIALGRSDVVVSSNVVTFFRFVFAQAWLPYLIILITANRRVRAVSPLALAGLLVFSFSVLAVFTLSFALLDVAAARRWLLAVPAAPSVLFLVAAVPVGLLCWWGLRLLGRAYDRKSFSDFQLVVDTWWLIVVFDVVASSASDLGWSALYGLFAWVVYRLGVEVLLRLWQPDEPAQTPRLLLLRVFGFQRRSETLFDAVAQRWRFRGSVTLITGTDLISRIIDPGDVVSFAAGRLKQQFVQSGSDLQTQLARLDEKRDRDGRFRVNNLFCHDNTWRTTLQAVLRRSDVVLMDLRGFSATSRGCQFELQQLAENGLLTRSVFVVDETTDLPLLETSLRNTARTAPADPEGGGLNLVHARGRSEREIQSIYQALRSCA